MSAQACLAYICKERGIRPKKAPKSKKLAIDHILEELQEKRDSEEIILHGVNLCETARPITEEQRLASVRNKIDWRFFK